MSNDAERALARRKGQVLMSGSRKAQPRPDDWRDKEKLRQADVDKTMRLRALRLAKDAADKEAAERQRADKLAEKAAAAATKRSRANASS
jgi:hypothetical protein